jgi:hypothetical protein
LLKLQFSRYDLSKLEKQKLEWNREIKMDRQFADLNELCRYLSSLAVSPSTEALKYTLDEMPVSRGQRLLVFERASQTLQREFERDRYSASLTHAFWHGTRNICQNIGIYLRLSEEQQVKLAPMLERNLILLGAMLYTNARNFRLFIRDADTSGDSETAEVAKNLLNEVRYEVYPELVRLAAQHTGLSTSQVESRIKAKVRHWRQEPIPSIEGHEFIYPIKRHDYEAA